MYIIKSIKRYDCNRQPGFGSKSVAFSYCLDEVVADYFDQISVFMVWAVLFLLCRL